jgi:membrane dipeptidase
MMLFPPLRAQEITIMGTVRDSSTYLAIDSARITIQSKTNPNERYTTLTNQNGNWTFTFQSTGTRTEPLPARDFRVEQNFPNPFNPSTRIVFRTGAAGSVCVSVYNTVGELLDEKFLSVDAGSHSIEWRSKGAAGALYYTVEFGGTRMTRKMMQLDGGSNGGLGSLTSYGGNASVPDMKKVAMSEYIITASNLIYMPDSAVITPQQNLRVDFSLSTVHNRAFVIDLHNDVLEKVVDGYQLGIRNTFNHSDLPRFRDGGYDAQMFAVWVSPSDTVVHTYYSYCIEMIDSFKSQLAMNAGSFAQARNAAEIAQANAAGKLAGILAVEGGHSIENSIEKLYDFYNRGMRYLTITWNNSTSWAVSAQDNRSTTVGLSEFGRQIIRTLDSLGVLIDVAHTGIKTINDILAVTKNPIVDTHAGVRALNNHYRNLYDYQIDSIAARGGVIGVVFYPAFLSSRSIANIDTVIKHIDYIRNRVGIDYVALGSDYDGIGTVPAGLEDVSKLPNLTAALLRRGYSVADVRKILGENYMRVFKKVCSR